MRRLFLLCLVAGCARGGASVASGPVHPGRHCAVFAEFANDDWHRRIVCGAPTAAIDSWIARVEARPRLEQGASGKPLAWLNVGDFAGVPARFSATRNIGLLTDVGRVLDRELPESDLRALRAIFDREGRPFEGDSGASASPPDEHLPSPSPPAATSSPSVSEPHSFSSACSGSDVDLNAVLRRPECVVDESPEDAALAHPIEEWLTTSVEPATATLPQAATLTLHVQLASSSDHSLTLYFRFDPTCTYGASSCLSPAGLGVRCQATGQGGRVFLTSLALCAAVPGQLRTSRVVLAPHARAHLDIEWSSNRLDERGIVHALPPGSYDVRVWLPLVGVADLPGHEKTTGETRVTLTPIPVTSP